MILSKDNLTNLQKEWTNSRYFPETSFMDFLRMKGIRFVDTEKLKLRVTIVTDVRGMPVDKAGVEFFDILQDIIEGKEEVKFGGRME